MREIARDILSHSVSSVVLRMSFALLICAASIGEAAADVSYSPKSGDRVARIMISGEITKEDLSNFSTFVGMARKDTLYQVLLNSKGGDVETAISMGKILRADGGKTYVAVMEGNSCVSSCVFFWREALTAMYGAAWVFTDPFHLPTLGPQWLSKSRTMNA